MDQQHIQIAVSAEWEESVKAVEHYKHGVAIMLETVWAAEYIILDSLYFSRWRSIVRRGRIGTSEDHFTGTHPNACLGLEIAAGVAETAVIAADERMGNHTVEIVNGVESADFLITGVCNGIAAYHDLQVLRQAQYALRVTRTVNTAVDTAAEAEQIATVTSSRYSMFGNALGALCNIAEGAMSGVVAATNDSHLGDVNTDLEMGCSAAGILVGVLTGDPAMIIASAAALFIQLIIMAVETEIDAPLKVTLYEHAYEIGEGCLSGDQALLAVPVLLFHTGLHSGTRNGRYGSYIHPVEVSEDVGMAVSDNLFPKF